MSDWWYGFAVGAAVSALLTPAVLLFLRLRCERVEPGQALVLCGRRRTSISFRTRIVWPGTRVHRILVRAHELDLALLGDDAVWSRDRSRIDVVARARVRVDRDPEKLLEVVDRLGCEQASEGKVVADLLVPFIEEALHAVASTFTGEDVYGRRLDFRDRVLELVAPHLRGFVIEDLAISTFQKIG